MTKVLCAARQIFGSLSTRLTIRARIVSNHPCRRLPDLLPGLRRCRRLDCAGLGPGRSPFSRRIGLFLGWRPTN